MSDVIDKLRAMASQCDYPENCEWDQECMEDAADEIEQLRAEVVRLRECVRNRDAFKRGEYMTSEEPVDEMEELRGK
jgi:tRNA U34 5-carboxymethylaminomethyl modifying GTPase MnmE/TrmE